MCEHCDNAKELENCPNAGDVEVRKTKLIVSLSNENTKLKNDLSLLCESLKHLTWAVCPNCEMCIPADRLKNVRTTTLTMQEIDDLIKTYTENTP